MGTWIEQKLERMIENSRPYMYDANYSLRHDKRCEVYWDPNNTDQILVEDLKQERVWYLPRQLFENPDFDIASWYQARLLSRFGDEPGANPFESLNSPRHRDHLITLQETAVMTESEPPGQPGFQIGMRPPGSP